MRRSVMLPLRLVSVLNVREHHMARARRTKRHRLAAALTLRAAYGSAERLTGRLIVTFTRIAPRPLDCGDNLEASCKALRDGVADWLGIDDSDPRVTWRCAQARGGPRQYAARIDIDEAGET